MVELERRKTKIEKAKTTCTIDSRFKLLITIETCSKFLSVNPHCIFVHSMRNSSFQSIIFSLLQKVIETGKAITPSLVIRYKNNDSQLDIDYFLLPKDSLLLF